METAKRLLTVFSIVLGVFLFVGSFSNAGINEWTTLGPQGLWVSSITIDPQNPDIVYLATVNNNLGIYKSTDGGIHWEQKNNGLHSLNMSNIVINPNDPNILYAGTNEEGVFKSIDGGESWVPKSQGIPYGLFGTNAVQHLAMDPEDPDRLYAAHDCFGLYLSIDGGENWERILSPSGPCYYRNITINPMDPNIIYIGMNRNFFTNQGLIFKSTDRGSTWTDMMTGMKNDFLTVFDLAIDPVRPETLYASGHSDVEGYNVYKSTDGARNWINVNNNMKTYHTRAIDIDPINPDIIYTGSIPVTGSIPGGVYKSTDGGGSWTQKRTGLISDNIYSLAVDPLRSDIVYAGTWYGGIFKTTNGGENWQDLTTSIMSTSWVLNVTLHPENASIIYASTKSGLYKTTDKGVNWHKVENGLPQYFSPRTLVIDPEDTRRLYLATESYGGMYRSTDDGETWAESNTGLGPPDWIIPVVIHPDSSNVIFIGTYGDGIFRSDDYGQTWHFWTGHFRGKIVWSIVIHPDNLDIIFVSTNEEVYKSTNGGRSWAKKMEGLFGNHFQLTMDPHNADILWVYNYNNEGPDGGIFKSVDGGESWVRKDQGLLEHAYSGRSIYALIIDPEDSNIMYCSELADCYWWMGVYMSRNGGEHWESIVTEAVEYSCIYDLKFDPEDHNTIFAGTKGASVATYTRVETSIDDPFVTSHAPQEYALFQNYPNPFNATTSIQYAVISDRYPPHVTLKIFNVLGQEVRALVNDVKETGHYTVVWNGRDNGGCDVASGVYFYLLTVGDFTATRHMLLLK